MMSSARREEAVERIIVERVSAIIRTNDQALAADAMSAAVAGGFRIVEFTLTTPGAMALIARFAEYPDVLVGPGRVVERARSGAGGGRLCRARGWSRGAKRGRWSTNPFCAAEPWRSATFRSRPRPPAW